MDVTSYLRQVCFYSNLKVEIDKKFYLFSIVYEYI